jgi:hypothetical protein
MQFLRNYVSRWADYQRSDGHCGAGWALFDFGARSFGGADAVLVSPYAHYIACDLFAYNDARVIQMLDRHNQSGVRAVYMQGVRGRVPTIDAIATVMQNTWGLPTSPNWNLAEAGVSASIPEDAGPRLQHESLASD